MAPGRLLLHVCCGPCTTAVLEALRRNGCDVDGFFYNPNIHPAAEYERRRQSMLVVAERMDLEVRWHHPEHELEEYLRAVRGREQERCRACYELRLGAAAREAAARGLDGFTTTLLISPYQDPQMLRESGEAAAAQHGTQFVFDDFRPLYRESREMAKQLDLYQQKYCGCLFSEIERAQRLAEREAHKAARRVERRP